MKKLFINPNTSKEGMKEVVSQLISQLSELGFELYMDKDLSCLPDDLSNVRLMNQDEGINACECILAIGGDGTILRVALSAAKANKPVLGINKGTLGFIPELEMTDVHMIKSLLTEDFIVDKRMLLDISVISKDGKVVYTDTALNDLSVLKGTLSKMIGLSIFVNGKKTMSFSGDGLIICSPTGSTAYSLAAGGPILEPSCECIAVTPLCPHAINIKSFVLPASHTVEIKAEPNPNAAYAFSDGSAPFELSEGDVIRINKSELSLELVRIKNLGFYDVIRKKLSKGEHI